MTATTSLSSVRMGARRERSRRAAWNVAAIVVIWGTSLFVLALWVAGGGIGALFALDAESLNTLGRLSGLVSANLLLYQVLLMARVPVFEHGFGRDTITRMHRLVGMWSFWLLLVHIVLLVAGYAAQSALNPFVQLWEFVWDYPGMLLAAAGTGLLVLVMITSAHRARRRLRYESWHLLHLYGYLGVGLAIPHMLWTGADFTASPLATAYWWALWAVTAAAVLAFRVVTPLWRSFRHDIRVHEISPDGRRGVSIHMRGRAIERLRAQAGQFFVWRFLDGAGWSRGHPFSLAAAPERGELVIAARLVGDGTARLPRLRRGTRVLVEGPYGHLTAASMSGRRLLMLGAGAGVAPLVALLESASYESGEAIIVTRDHDPRDAMRTAEIQRLREMRGVRHYALDGPRSPHGTTWLPAAHAEWNGVDFLRRLTPDVANCDVFLCGPPSWMASLQVDLAAAGVPRDRTHSEAFTH